MERMKDLVLKEKKKKGKIEKSIIQLTQPKAT